MSFDLSRVDQWREWSPETVRFCEDFCRNSSVPKYILGRNIYAESVIQFVRVTGFIDDYTKESFYLGLPVVKSTDVLKHALVLNVSGGRPLSARTRLNREGLRNLDYFAFSKASGLPLLPMRFNEGFEAEFLENRAKYEWAYQLLGDLESKSIFEKIVRFRFDYDISHLEGFSQKEDVQYFEDFLALKPEGEIFVDIGAYDGYTSLEFIKRCPQYQAIYAFEPDQINFHACCAALHGFPNIHCYPVGLSSSKATLRFNISGSSSKISDTGSANIEVERLDDVLDVTPSFLKMDIEGGESAAIDGGRETIASGRHGSRLAISVYHTPGDFWRIPEQILSIREDYEIYMRHYTECIYETVMFFLPRK